MKIAAKQLGFVSPAVVQSMYIFKQPGHGGEGTVVYSVILGVHKILLTNYVTQYIQKYYFQNENYEK